MSDHSRKRNRNTLKHRSESVSNRRFDDRDDLFPEVCEAEVALVRELEPQLEVERSADALEEALSTSSMSEKGFLLQCLLSGIDRCVLGCIVIINIRSVRP